jgi:hypothetical protein
VQLFSAVREEEVEERKRKRNERKREKEKEREKMEKLLNLEILGEKNKRKIKDLT